MANLQKGSLNQPKRPSLANSVFACMWAELPALPNMKFSKNLQEVAFILWKESWELGKNPMASKGSPLHGPRIKLIEKAQNLFAETKEHTFESKAAEEHAKLLR